MGAPLQPHLAAARLQPQHLVQVLACMRAAASHRTQATAPPRLITGLFSLYGAPSASSHGARRMGVSLLAWVRVHTRGIIVQ